MTATNSRDVSLHAISNEHPGTPTAHVTWKPFINGFNQTEFYTVEMAKRGASMESDEVMTKCSKSYTSLDDVSCGFSGLFSLTDPVRIEAVHWRDNGCFWGCVQCRRKVDTKCSLHPDSGSKVYYRLRVLIRQGDVLLWLTAFDEIATIIVGTPASEYGSLDVLGRRKLVDSVVGLHFLVNVVKTVKSGFTNFAFAKIYPARTKFPDAVLDSIKPTVC